MFQSFTIFSKKKILPEVGAQASIDFNVGSLRGSGSVGNWASADSLSNFPSALALKTN